MRILCFGDSNTYGFDPRSFFGDRYPARDRWVDLLAEQTGWELINEGANGRVIPRNLYILRSLEKSRADRILVMLGTNDLLQGASAGETAARMERFLTALLPHCPVTLAAPPPLQRGAWVPTDALVRESVRLGEAYRLLAQKLRIPFADTRDWHIDLCFDGVHFSEAGHRAFAKKLQKALDSDAAS